MRSSKYAMFSHLATGYKGFSFQKQREYMPILCILCAAKFTEHIARTAEGTANTPPKRLLHCMGYIGIMQPNRVWLLS